jgi:hypothetical protein
MPHLHGVSRDEVLLFPPSLDEYITDENPVRFIDAFVDQLDLPKLGFTRAVASRLGRPAYYPGDLLKRSVCIPTIMRPFRSFGQHWRPA